MAAGLEGGSGVAAGPTVVMGCGRNGRRAAVVSPAGVVEEAGWARVGSGGGVGEEPTVGSSVEANLVAASSWTADPAEEALPKPGREGSVAGASAGVVRKGGEGAVVEAGRRHGGESPPSASGAGGRRRRRRCVRRRRCGRRR
jgi:hypothetical protein